MEGSPTGRSRRRTPTTPGARRTRSSRRPTKCARRSVGTRRRRPGRRLPVASTAPVTTRCSCAPPTSAPLWELLTLFGGYSRTTSSNGTTGCRCPRPCQYVRQSWTTGSSSSPSGCRRRSRCAPWRRRGCCARPRAPAPCHMRSSSGRRQGCGSHWGPGCAKGCATPHGTGLPARSRGLPSPSTRCSSVRSWTATIAGPAGRVACRPCCPWRCGTTASSERPRRCRGRARRAHRGAAVCHDPGHPLGAPHDRADVVAAAEVGEISTAALVRTFHSDGAWGSPVIAGHVDQSRAGRSCRTSDVHSTRLVATPFKRPSQRLGICPSRLSQLLHRRSGTPAWLSLICGMPRPDPDPRLAPRSGTRVAQPSYEWGDQGW